MNPKPVQSLQRGLALVDALARQSQGMSLKELSVVADCSPAATFHLVQTLVACGYAQRHESPVRYTLGDKLYHLAQSQQQDRLQQVVEEQLRYIHEQLPEASIFFSQYVGGQVAVRCRLMPQAAGVIQRDVNQILPAYVSAGSLIHMAYWSDDQREQFRAQYSYEAYGRIFWGEWDAYESLLGKVRKGVVAMVPERVGSHLKLGLPVLSPSGVLRGAITIQWNKPTRDGLADRKKRIKQLGLSVVDRITQGLKGASK